MITAYYASLFLPGHADVFRDYSQVSHVEIVAQEMNEEPTYTESAHRGTVDNSERQVDIRNLGLKGNNWLNNSLEQIINIFMSMMAN